jgi:hypothetical protein
VLWLWAMGKEEGTSQTRLSVECKLGQHLLREKLMWL